MEKSTIHDWAKKISTDFTTCYKFHGIFNWSAYFNMCIVHWQVCRLNSFEVVVLRTRTLHNIVRVRNARREAIRISYSQVWTDTHNGKNSAIWFVSVFRFWIRWFDWQHNTFLLGITIISIELKHVAIESGFLLFLCSIYYTYTMTMLSLSYK